MNEREDLLFALCMALRKVPRGILRDLGKPRLPSDELAEKVVAKAIVAHLELCGWRLEHVRRRDNCPHRLRLRKAQYSDGICRGQERGARDAGPDCERSDPSSP